MEAKRSEILIAIQTYDLFKKLGVDVTVISKKATLEVQCPCRIVILYRDIILIFTEVSQCK